MNEMNKQKMWDREEVVILVTEYFRTKNFSASDLVVVHQKISDFLRKREEIKTGAPISETFRDYAGIHMQSSRIRCLDPETDVSGMHGTKLQKEIIQEYFNNPRRLTEEAREIYKKYDLDN